jgi:intracellular septation protein
MKPGPHPMSQKMRFFLDFGPLVAFFLAYRYSGLMAATAVIIAGTLLSLAVTYAKEKKVAVMPLVTAVVVSVFGGLTLWLQDEQFIKMKPTIVNLLFATILLGGLATGRPMLKYLLGSAIQMREEGWKKLSFRWGVFFVFLAALNEVIWRHFSTDFWVNFKVFGMLTITIAFTLSQVPMMQRYMNENQ